MRRRFGGRGVRRAALLVVPALFALVSCGVPETGVVEAGEPAGGVVPTVRVYLVGRGTLVPVPRRTPAPIEVDVALDILLQGPTEAEGAKRLTTRLPRLTLFPQSLATPPVTGAPEEAAPSADVVEVTTRGGRVIVQVAASEGELGGLAADQLICTALAAQRAADPRTEPKPVTVRGAEGRDVKGTGASCPE
jgi:hypothetical protein